jgi:hypothetical protein
MAVKKVQTQKRIQFLDSILEAMKKHEIFSDIVSRKNDTEYQIQKNLFLRLQNELPNLLISSFGYSEKKAKHIVKNNFKWEQKKTTTVSTFSFFATNHRPDAELEFDNLRIAIEIKKGDNGLAIRSGIGQSIVYYTEFDFVLYFFVDTSPGNNIKSNCSGGKENLLIESLWNNYNIKFIVV